MKSSIPFHRTSRCFRAPLSHGLALVTFWGVNDANSWRSRGHPLLFDRDAKPKPAFDAAVKLPDALKAP
jgi:GH35 family endo-1,4-beta-xylanase